jgi:hypothetical protein
MSEYPSTEPGHPTRDEITRLMEFAARFSVSILIRTRDERNRPCYRSGGGLLVAAAENRWLVTAWHVLHEYRNLYVNDAATLLDVSGCPLQPSKRMISEDASTDLAVIDVSDVVFPPRVPNLAAPEFFDPIPWPGNEVFVGDRIFFFGWPGAYRYESDGGLLLHIEGDGIMNLPVTGISDHEFQIKFDRANWDSFLAHASRKPDDYIQDHRLGGHSGTPVFRISPIGERPELVGFVKEYRDDDAVICCPVTKIRTNGTVKPSSIGYRP